ncbi:MAG: hypothetical protein EOO85_33610, partial [Pedobacter sp.]
MEVHVKIVGALLIILSLVHVIFPKYFKWSEELIPLSLINRQMMYVHTFFIAILLLLMGILCVTESHELVVSPLGKKITLGFSIFWFLRLLVQFFGYSSILWRGKGLETSIHIVFSFLWMYM